MCEKVIGKDELICKQCYQRLPRIHQPSCFQCGQQLKDDTDEYCYDCKNANHRYEQGVASLVYEGQTKKMMYRFKYANRREYKDLFGALLVSDYGQWMQNQRIEAILPIPLYKRRYGERGYNQAALIAREVGRLTGIKVYEQYLIRAIETDPQKMLSDEERKKNIKNAFQVIENKVQLRRILLIDDIYTTGSTIDAAADCLKKAGTKCVYSACVCIGQGY